MSRGAILLRVDGSAEEGMGRVARCLALANALQRRRYQMTFVTRIDHPGWPDRMRRFRHLVSRTPFPAGAPEDREALLREGARLNPTIVVVDAANVGEDYLRELATRTPLVICLDETAKTRLPCGMAINPTFGHDRADYALGAQTQLLAGAKYLMIRSEFRRARNVRATEPGGPPRILIALGGGEVAKETADYARAILETNVAEKVDAVIGTSKQHRDVLEAMTQEFSGRLFVTADARDLGIRMTKANLLITGGGNTALEAGCVGVPTIMIARRARHQLNATWLEELGVAQFLGYRENVKPSQVAQASKLVLEDSFERKAMSRSGRMLIDGRGADRIVTAAEILLHRTRRRQAIAA